MVFWLCCAWYVFTASGHTYSPDEETMYAVTRAIIHTGQVNIVTDGSEAMASLRSSPIGAVAPYGILPSLLAIPFYLIGLLVSPNATTHWDMTHLLVSLCNAPISAGCVALLYRMLWRLNVPHSSIIILTITYAVGSLTWPYARTFFSEPLTTLLMLWSVDAAISAQHHPHTAHRSLLLSGVMAGLIIATRIAASVVIPMLGLYAILYMPSQRIRSAIYWGIGCIPGVLLFGIYNYIRFRTFFSTGYLSESTSFNTPLSVGIPGLLIEPATGLLWFVPMCILAPFGAWFLWRQHRHIVILATILIASQVLLYAGWIAWDGGGVWGPRFLVPIVPYALLLCSGLWYAAPALATTIARPLLAVSIVINILGCAVNFNIDSNLPIPRPPPIVAHAQIAWQRWSAAVIPSASCVLQHGWYPSEAADGYLYQRSGATADITCRLPAMTHITLWTDDRRPANAPPSNFTITVNTQQPLPIPMGNIRIVHLLAPRDLTHIRFQSTPWNPVTIAYSDRNDDLGPTILALTSRPTAATVLNAAVAPIPTPAKARWAWHYDPTNRHMLDWWGWYTTMTSLAPWYAQLWVAWISGVLGMCGLAVWPAYRARRYDQSA